MGRKAQMRTSFASSMVRSASSYPQVFVSITSSTPFRYYVLHVSAVSPNGPALKLTHPDPYKGWT